jgi:glutamate formiminotransferase/formiminotetrahydrofolate cyclodeaminase
VAEIFESAASVSALLGGLEAAAPSPAGGTAAAVVAAMAASLVVMAGRQSPGWPDGAAVAADAERLRDRLLALGAEDVQAFAAVLAAFRSSDAGASSKALVHAAEVPLEIAECAADVAELAVRAAADGKRPLRPDAEAAAILAEAAARAAALVVRVNATALPADGDQTTKTRLLEAALAARARASAVSS